MATIETFHPRITPSPPMPFDPPEDQRQALAADIEAQLSIAPTRVTDLDTCRHAKETLPLLKRAEDKVVAFFKPLKGAAHRAHKMLCDKETEHLKPIKALRASLSNEVYRFEQEQERIRRQHEREAQEDEQRRMQDAALEEAAMLAHVAPEMADQIVEQAIAAPPPAITLPSTAVSVAGVSSTANWQFKFAGCASGLAWDALPQEDRDRVMRLLPREYLRPDDKAITEVVKALKGGTRIPGIEVFDAGTVRVRS